MVSCSVTFAQRTSVSCKYRERDWLAWFVAKTDLEQWIRSSRGLSCWLFDGLYQIISFSFLVIIIKKSISVIRIMNHLPGQNVWMVKTSSSFYWSVIQSFK